MESIPSHAECKDVIDCVGVDIYPVIDGIVGIKMTRQIFMVVWSVIQLWGNFYVTRCKD